MKQIAIILLLFWLGLIALVTTACKPEPDPGGFNGGGSNDTTETLVKKYLVKECLGVGDSLIPIRIINWNDDYTKIVHITTIKSGNSHCLLEHDFEYYGEDSLCILITQPQSLMWWPLFTRCTCHLEEGIIKRIDYYHDSVFQCSDLFEYDELGRIMKRKVEDAGIEYLFEWDGENVVRIINSNTGEEIDTYGDFCDHIHPDYTLPYCLFDGYYDFLTQPFWKNMYRLSSNYNHDCDVDGYVSRIYYIDELGNETTFRTYEYSN